MLATLIEQIRPDRCERVWAEPYNDRDNWRAVQAGYQGESQSWHWFDRAFGSGEPLYWSSYATELYARLKYLAERDGWLPRLRYLLYEDGIIHNDALWFRGLAGVLLQSKPVDEGPSKGRSRNPHIAALQVTSG